MADEDRTGLGRLLGLGSNTDLDTTLVPAAPTAPVPAAGAPVPAGPRYRVVRPHARGGLGQVFVAEDQELQREVALKEIQAQHADDEGSRARFLLEARVTGRLEHPGVVPVYGLGAYADGRPFYAMRFIRGESLEQAIARTRAEAAQHTPAQRSLALRGLLDRFVAVCNAIAYAHGQGVLHRDLKPSNVMLGPYGETLVVDWGLARVLGQPDAAGAGPSLVSAALTRVGDMTGTPRYMPPEQAAGKIDQLGPASDVYGLGAILYCILTGGPPLPDLSLEVVLERSLKGDIPPPRQVSRHVPAALSAVCHKAMALRPEDRYASALDLAADVERWLADEPVSCCSEPLTVRLARWGRRHRTLLTVAVALLVVTVVFLLVFSALTHRAREVTQAALRSEEQARKDRALAQVDALLDSNPQAALALIDGLAPCCADVEPRLRELWEQAVCDHDCPRMARVGLALLRTTPSVKDALLPCLLETNDPQELLLLREGLQPHAADLRPALWQKAKDDRLPADQRFHALVVLATFDPEGAGWRELTGTLLDRLPGANPMYFGTWVKALRPARAALIGPLTQTFRKATDATTRERTASILADYASDDPALLVDLTADADERQYAALRRALAGAPRASIVELLERELARPAPPPEQWQARDHLAKRQARSAVALLQLGVQAPVWPLLRWGPDPSRRTYLLHLLANPHTAPEAVVRRLGSEKEPSARRALVLCLGELEQKLAPAERRRLTERLLALHREDGDPGMHSAAEWVLRRWGHEEDLKRLAAALARDKGWQGKRGWYVNGQGQTFALVRVVPGARVGSPPWEPGRIAEREALRPGNVERPFVMSTHQVTVAQFLRFHKDHSYRKEYAPSLDGPIIDVSWYEAARYCNWLSKVEGLPPEEWCYPEKIGPGMKMPDHYLARIGYRLPMEDEWECAARAGSTTSRFYGTTSDLLGHYAWYSGSRGDESARPVGLLMPNDAGLFDVYGNAAVWCQDAVPARKGHPNEDRLGQERAYRGGGFFNRAGIMRSAYRTFNQEGYYNYHVGLRPARTVR